MDDEEDERLAKTEAFSLLVDSNVKAGRLRIVCGVDERIGRLEHLVTYLSAHSDLQVVLLRVNRFLVNKDMTVLVPTLRGDTQGEPGHNRRTPTVRFTVASLVDSFRKARRVRRSASSWTWQGLSGPASSRAQVA